MPKVKCEHCGGDGTIYSSNNRKTQCLSCGGKGHRNIPDEEIEDDMEVVD